MCVYVCVHIVAPLNFCVGYHLHGLLIYQVHTYALFRAESRYYIPNFHSVELLRTSWCALSSAPSLVSRFQLRTLSTDASFPSTGTIGTTCVFECVAGKVKVWFVTVLAKALSLIFDLRIFCIFFQMTQIAATTQKTLDPINTKSKEMSNHPIIA